MAAPLWCTNPRRCEKKLDKKIGFAIDWLMLMRSVVIYSWGAMDTIASTKLPGLLQLRRCHYCGQRGLVWCHCREGTGKAENPRGESSGFCFINDLYLYMVQACGPAPSPPPMVMVPLTSPRLAIIIVVVPRSI